MTLQNKHFTSDEVAIGWARQNFDSQHEELVADNPWSKVYRLQGNEGSGILKLLPRHGKNTLDKSALIHDRFGGVTPEVSAINQELGLLFMPEENGIRLTELASEKQIRKLLLTYADIQVQAAHSPGQLVSIDEINLVDLFGRLLHFLDPESKKEEGKVGADFFLDPVESKNYGLALRARAQLLEPLLESACSLPPTLNHCDLHIENVLERYDGSMVILDWDDAVIGPAGLSLGIIFKGCANIEALLESNAPASDDPDFFIKKRLINEYIEQLVRGGYADQSSLRSALPATIFMGVMNSIVDYGNYPNDDHDYKENIASIIRTRLEDLIRLSDLKALKNRNTAIYFAEDYRMNGVPWRAASLLREYVSEHMNDLEVHHRLADIYAESGQWADAIESYGLLINSGVEQPEIYNALGNALLKNEQADLSVREFERALDLNPQFEPARKNLEIAGYVLHSIDRAKIPHLAPAIRLSDQEMQQGSVILENLNLATGLFKQYGNVVVENMFPVELVQQISKIVFEKYNSYFEDRKYEDNLVLGDKRRMVTLGVEGPINSPTLYGGELLTGMMKRLLGDDYVMGGLNGVVALPGAKNQGLHKDYPPLFRYDGEEHMVTPPFAVALLTPLIDMSKEHGVTAFRKGSHLVPEQMPFEMEVQEPLLKMGDAVIFDYRTAHEGLANRSNEVRPLLCLIFHRIWFRDALNYERQKDVQISPEEFKKVPENLRHLFKWVC